MRNKFTEMVAQGVAKFEYTPISPETTTSDPVCRTYNNIFALPTDTHMHLLNDGRRVITGHMVNSLKWGDFLNMPMYANIDFRTTGYESFVDFMNKFGLCGKLDALNGDVVYIVEPINA